MHYESFRIVNVQHRVLAVEALPVSKPIDFAPQGDSCLVGLKTHVLAHQANVEIDAKDSTQARTAQPIKASQRLHVQRVVNLNHA